MHLMKRGLHTVTMDTSRVRRSRPGFLRALLVSAVVALVAAGTGVWVLASRSPSARYQSIFAQSVTGVTPVGDQGAGTEDVVVAMDGWSVASLPTRTLSAALVSTHTDASTRFTLRPATEEELRALLHDEPRLVTTLFARLVTLDPTTTCSADECRASGKPLALSEVVHPATIPGYGREYAGYHVTDGLWLARLSIPTASQGVQISVPHWKASLFLPTTTGPDLKTLKTHPLAAKPSAADGYLKNDYLLGAGLGQLFVDDPAWVGRARPGYADLGLPNDTHTGVLSPVQKALGAGTFAHGLGVAVPAAAALSSTLLTWMTSAVTGCGPGVACVPGTAEVTVAPGASVELDVCSGAATQPMDAVMSDSTWNVTYDAPTAQFGIWKGKVASSLPDPGPFKPASGLWNGVQPLLTGTVTERQSVIFVFRGTPPVLSIVGGRSAEYGTTPRATLTTPFGATSLGQVGPYRVCAPSSHPLNPATFTHPIK